MLFFNPIWNELNKKKYSSGHCYVIDAVVVVVANSHAAVVVANSHAAVVAIMMFMFQRFCCCFCCQCSCSCCC